MLSPTTWQKYCVFRVTNDMALLHLSQDVVFTANIVPACLPTVTTNTYANQMAIVSGKYLKKVVVRQMYTILAKYFRKPAALEHSFIPLSFHSSVDFEDG